jgi:hypothetical protein
MIISETGVLMRQAVGSAGDSTNPVDRSCVYEATLVPACAKHYVPAVRLPNDAAAPVQVSVRLILGIIAQIGIVRTELLIAPDVHSEPWANLGHLGLLWGCTIAGHHEHVPGQFSYVELAVLVRELAGPENTPSVINLGPLGAVTRVRDSQCVTRPLALEVRSHIIASLIARAQRLSGVVQAV